MVVRPRRICLGQNGVSMCYIYILQSCIDKTLYRGSMGDLRQRFKEHNEGKVKSTKFRCPWKLICYEGFLNKTDARREELFLKRGKGRERIKYLLEET